MNPITAWMMRATVRDALGDAGQVKYVYTRYQEAVPFFVENNLTPSGVTAFQMDTGGDSICHAESFTGHGDPRSPSSYTDQMKMDD